MNKRVISLFLTVVLLALPLFGCKPKNNNSNFSNQNTTGKSLPAAAVALANEIDRLTTVQDLLLGSISASGLHAAVTSSTSSLSATVDTVYTRDPEDLEVTYDLGLDFQGANGQIEAMKQLKKEALKECTEPNVWFKVNSFSYSPRYRLIYHEENNDTVTVEFNNDSVYRKATVSHNEDGKLVIDAYTVQYSNEVGSQTSQIHYLEDAYIRVRHDMVDEETGTQYRPTLLFVDLVNTSYATVAPANRYQEDGTVQEGASARFCYWDKDGQYFVYSEPDYTELYRNDKLVINGEKDRFYMYLNNCTGWSHMDVFDAGSPEQRVFVLHTDTGTVENPPPFVENPEPYTFSFWLLQGKDMLYHEPTILLWLDPSYTQTREDAVRFFDDLQRDLGIALPEEDEQVFLDALFGYDELASQTLLIDGIYASDITLEVYAQLADMLVYDEVTREELAEMRAEDAIEKDVGKGNAYDVFGNSQGGMVNTN